MSENNKKNKFNSHKFSQFNLNPRNNLYSFVPLPQSDELLSSWIYRLALANFYSFSKFFKNLKYESNDSINRNNKIEQTNFNDLDRNISNKLINILSEKTDLAFNEISKLSIKEWKTHFPVEFFNKLNPGVSGGIYYCSLCLKEDKIPYFRKSWKLRFIPYCLKHKIKLCAKCPNPKCKKPVFFPNFKYGHKLNECGYCGYSLSKIKNKLESVNKKEFNMVKIFIEILNSNKWKSNNGEIFTSLEFFNSLFDIMKFIAINNKNKELNHHVNINKVQGILEDIPMVLESTISILQIDECFSLILPVAYEYLGEYPKTIMVLCLMNPKSFSQIIRKKESNILSSYAIGKDLFIHSGIIKKNIIILIREGKVISYEKIANRMYKRNAFNHKIRQELLIYIEPIIQKRKNKFIQKVNSIIKNLSFYHNIYIIIDDYCNMDKKNHVKQLIKEIMDDFREKIGTFEKNIKNLKQIDLIKEKYSKKEVNLKIYHFCTLIFNNKVPGVRFYDASKFRNLFPLLNEKKKLFNENTIQKPKFIFKFREKKLSV